MSDPPSKFPPTIDYQPAVAPAKPTALVVVAWLFIAFGILDTIGMIAALFQGSCSVQLGVLGIFVGRGLLRFSRGWRTCGLVFLWLTIVGVPLVTLLILTASGSANVTFNGCSVSGPSRDEVMALAVLIGAAFWIGSIWCYRILVRPDVRRLFKLPNSEPL